MLVTSHQFYMYIHAVEHGMLHIVDSMPFWKRAGRWHVNAFIYSLMHEHALVRKA